MSLDLEDGRSVRYRPEGGRVDVGALEADVAAALEILDRVGARATFFVVGDVARASPESVRELVRRGHEIGCHGMSHMPVTLLSREGFRADVERALEALSAAGAPRVLGFRAPWWSIPAEGHWALDVLDALGFAYDSSIFPLRTTHYGSSSALRRAHRVSGRALFEVPASTLELGPVRLPGPSAFYCRALPLLVSRALLAGLEREGAPVHLYFHPWELRPLSRLSCGGMDLIELAIHAIGRSRMAAKLEVLLAGRSWAPIRDLVGEIAREAAA